MLLLTLSLLAPPEYPADRLANDKIAFTVYRPDATAGHSYGELTALCTAGCFDAPSLFELSQLRGRLMAEQGDDAGAMLAVQAPIEEVEGLLADDRLDLVIANRN